MIWPYPFPSQIIGSTSVGQSLLTAAGQAAARTVLGLAAVASSGNYADLTNTPSFGTAAFTSAGAYDAAGAASAAQAYSIQRANHTGVQSYTTITGLGSLANLNAAPAGTLTGTALNSTVVSSSLTSVSALSSGSATTGFTVADACLTSNVALKNATNTFTAAQYITGTGGLNVGSATTPKGTGVAGSRLEVQGTGTGLTAYGSLAISRADSTSDSVVGSIDFYTISTLAAQIQCIQQSGGAGGVNYLYFNLGSAGTLHNCAYLDYNKVSAISTFYIGTATNYPGKLQIQNYAPVSNTRAIQLSNPVSAANTGSTSIAWVDVAGNAIGQIRTNYIATAGLGDLVFSVGQGITNGLQDFVKFANTNYINLYGLSSTTNRIQSAIQSTWANSTDATRQGRMVLYVDNTGTLQNAIQIDAASSSPTTTIAGGLSVSSTGMFWNAYWGASFVSNFAKHYYGQNGESITGSGFPNNSLHFAASGFQVGASNRDSYSHWFAGGSFDRNFGTISVTGSPANYARVRIDPELFSAVSAQTITLAATLYIGNAPAPATNLTITTSRALHVNSGESYFGGSVKVGTGSLHFNNGTPIARPTLPAAGVVVASDIRTALINLGLCQ